MGDTAGGGGDPHRTGGGEDAGGGGDPHRHGEAGCPGESGGGGELDVDGCVMS